MSIRGGGRGSRKEGRVTFWSSGARTKSDFPSHSFPFLDNALNQHKASILITVTAERHAIYILTRLNESPTFYSACLTFSTRLA